MDLAGILAIHDVYAGLAQLRGVGVALVAQGIKAGGDDERGRLGGQQLIHQRPGAHIGLVGLPAKILLRVPDDAVTRDDVAIGELTV